MFKWKNEVWEEAFSLGITYSGRENREGQTPWGGLSLNISKNNKKSRVAVPESAEGKKGRR